MLGEGIDGDRLSAGQPVSGERRIKLIPGSRLCRVLAVLLVTVAATLTVITCAVFRPVTAPLPEVVVLLERHVPELQLSIEGPYQVLNSRGKVIAEGASLKSGQMRVSSSGPLEINGVSLPAQECLVVPQKASSLVLGDRRYPGRLWLKATAQSGLEVRNVVDIESYVAGVLFWEMPASFPEEALKAQAVATRTYAYHRLLSGQRLLQATEADQVYGGDGRAARQARRIVAATHGELMTYREEVIPAYFSSTCGGFSGSRHQVFTEPVLPVLEARRCGSCESAPLYRWQRSLDLEELARRLQIQAPIQALRRRTDGFGRTLEVEVQTRDDSHRILGLRFRSLWNSGITDRSQQLPSAFLLQADLSADTIEIQGAGFGHGVGMCQYGAAGQGTAGKDYQEILQHYYHGMELERRW